MHKKIPAKIIGEILIENEKNYVASSLEGFVQFAFPIKEPKLKINDRVDAYVYAMPKRGVLALISIKVGRKNYYSARYSN